MTDPASLLGARPALAVYVHWPYCARICPYCDFNVALAKRPGEPEALLDAILADLDGHREQTGPRALASVFLGGGTPSLMAPDWAARIVERARALWPPAGPVEVTLEANPTDAEAERFAGFAAAGVNRLSLGVQSLHDEALAFLGRNHTAAEARRAADLARDAFERLSIDLIYARPGQTPAAWAEELTAALDLGPEHVSAYQLTIEPGTPFQRAVARGRWSPPGEDQSADLYKTTQGVLGERGFDAYEISNHARGPAARSAHNLIYWRGGDYVGVGPGAHGRLSPVGEARIATRAASRAGDYIRRVAKTGLGWADSETLSPREAALERLLTGLRTEEGVAFDDLAPLGLHGEHPLVARLAEAGLLRTLASRLVATGAGRLVLDRVIAELAQAAYA